MFENEKKRVMRQVFYNPIEGGIMVKQVTYKEPLNVEIIILDSDEESEILELRKSGEPGFLLVFDGKYYYTKLTKRNKFVIKFILKPLFFTSSTSRPNCFAIFSGVALPSFSKILIIFSASLLLKLLFI